MVEHLRQPIIYVASDEQLTCRECYVDRWVTIKRLTHLSRRQLVIEVEQYFARSSHTEFHFMDTNEIYHPGFCWSDVDARWVSQYLEQRDKIAGEEPRRLCMRKLEYQRQIECYLCGSIAQRWEQVQGFIKAHQHPGWERLQ